MARSTFAKVHKWVGLGLAAFWLLQAATGLVLTYVSVLDQEAWPSQTTPTPAEFAGAYTAVQQTYPSLTISRVMLSQPDSRVLDVFGSNPAGEARRIRVDRESGNISSNANWNAIDSTTPITRIAYRLHYDLLSGTIGHTIIGISGVFLLLTALVGIYLAWPQKGRWRTILRPVKWKRSMASYYSWHRAIGMWFSLLLILVALTGAALVWMANIRTLTEVPDPEPAVAASLVDPMEPTQGIVLASQLAKNALPEGQIYLIDPPSPALNRYRVRMRLPGEAREFYGTTAVYVDASATRVLGVYKATEASVTGRVLDAAYALHTGEILGWFGRLLFFLNGVGVIGLSVLGTALWYRKRKPAKARKAKRQRREGA